MAQGVSSARGFVHGGGTRVWMFKRHESKFGIIALLIGIECWLEGRFAGYPILKVHQDPGSCLAPIEGQQSW